MRNQTEIFLNFVKDGDIAEVRLLLDQGIDANSYLLDGEETALQVAVEHGHIDIVQLKEPRLALKMIMVGTY